MRRCAVDGGLPCAGLRPHAIEDGSCDVQPGAGKALGQVAAVFRGRCQNLPRLLRRSDDAVHDRARLISFPASKVSAVHAVINPLTAIG
jgi:hypothetical protein